MMTNLVLMPILIPFFGAIFLMLLPRKVILQRVLAIITSAVLIGANIFLVYYVYQHGILVVTLGNWPAPFGISIVGDMLAILLVTTTSLVLLATLIYSFYSIGKPRERFLYYPAVLFMIVGVNGSFLTGDIFNLFVFFEVMLMASYVLLVLGGTKVQLKATVKYLLINVIGSAFLVMAIALLYSMIGTLNMADISQKISEIHGGNTGMITVVAVLFLFVFGLKAGIFPLYFWLPGSYFAPPIPVLALFGALLTKVGVYAIIRVYTLFFYNETSFALPLLSTLALITIVLGVIGAISYNDMKTIMIYNILIAVGVILFSVSLMTREAMTGAIFYLIHDMLIKGTLFLVIGTIIAITGFSSIKKFSGLMSVKPSLGWTFFIGALGLAGIPPLSGFIGKLLIVEGAFAVQNYVGGVVVLLSSLFVLLSMIKIFSKGFWGEKKGTFKLDIPYRKMMVPVLMLLAISVAYGIFSEGMYPLIEKAVDPLVDPSIYIQAVLGE
ncbi:Na+/H+ antiporter subunit D [Listeria newyorkensis]|uniref:Na+/H+ antiporter subunit D n=2 Tax=Listeriaceae TaxID=186820 RepID=A0ABX4XM87_9LIST|nr:monovalent cation/H+ antiporter subunit D [Listeria newyorkensis]KGL46748.1 monovalent cation/H+ antiporter subunit D [Listeriaceae bacterium FSL A5-0209]KMT62033.1 Na+ H+ antiporter subunit D [Listeria newyorkensis]PNP92160.1 Na+/H+ antiporter subunit D [Listeria newyorkensis]SQC56473.1 Multiple resistance and pH homeostasis protein D [Listeria newyorkensis]